MPVPKKPESFGEGDEAVDFGQGDELVSKPVAAKPPNALQRFGSGLYDSTVGAVGSALGHPVDTAVGIAKSAMPHLPSPEQMSSAYGHLTTLGEREKLIGDYKDVVMGHPMVAPAIPIAQDAQHGNYAGAAGRAVGIGAMAAAPKALGSAGRALGIPNITPGLKGAANEGLASLKSPEVAIPASAGSFIGHQMGGAKGAAIGGALGSSYGVGRAAIRGFQEGMEGPRTPPPPPIAKPTPAPPIRWNQAPPEETPVKRVAPPPIRWNTPPPQGPPAPPSAPTPTAGPPQDILEGIARSQTGKSFAKLSPDQQATVSKLASTVPPTPEAPVISQPKTANPLPIVSSQQVAQMMADEMLSNKSITPEMVNKEIPPPPNPSPAAPSNIRNRRVK